VCTLRPIAHDHAIVFPDQVFLSVPDVGEARQDGAEDPLDGRRAEGVRERGAVVQDVLRRILRYPRFRVVCAAWPSTPARGAAALTL
jgi:hypothetical protein